MHIARAAKSISLICRKRSQQIMQLDKPMPLLFYGEVSAYIFSFDKNGLRAASSMYVLYSRSLSIITGNPDVSPGDWYIASEIYVFFFRYTKCNLTSLTGPYKVHEEQNVTVAKKNLG